MGGFGRRQKQACLASSMYELGVLMASVFMPSWGEGGGAGLIIWGFWCLIRGSVEHRMSRVGCIHHIALLITEDTHAFSNLHWDLVS